MKPSKIIDFFTDGLALKFYQFVEKSGSCWIWKGSKIIGKFGYGIFWFKGKHYYAHRISFAIDKKIDPGPKLVLHSCDNPICVNPSHLFLGTDYDNIHDCMKKGRLNHANQTGEKNNNSKLTEDIVTRVKNRWKNGGVLQKDLALIFHVSRATICMVLKGNRWSHLS